MKKRSGKYLILFSLFFLPLKAFSCGWWTEYEDIRYIIFNPNIVNNRAWWNFYYTTHMYYNWYIFKGDQDEKQLSAEWKQKLNLAASEEEIYNYLFASTKDSIRLSNGLQKEISKNKDFQTFTVFAKKCESNISLDDPWDDIQTDSLMGKRKMLIGEGLSLIKQQKDPFWSKKYAFQLLRLAYYYQDENLFNQMYNSWFGFRKEKAPLDWWATHYKSMWLERKGNLDSANFIHAMVYSHSSNKMYVSHYMYSSRNFEKQLALAKDNQEKSGLYLMKAIKRYDNALDEIRTAYALYPQHPLFPLALSREMNKVEDVFGTLQFNSNGDAYYPLHTDSSYLNLHKVTYIHRLYDEVQNMKEVARLQPDFYYLLLTNLAIMNRDIDMARKSLAQVKETDPTSVYQKKILGVMLTTITKNIKDEEVQEEMGKELEYLVENRRNTFASQNIMYSLFKYLEFTFREKQEKHLAVLIGYIAEVKLCFTCTPWSDDYEVIKRMDEPGMEKTILDVIKTWDKKDKNSLEKLLLSPYPHPYFFYDMLGTVYLRNNQVGKAMEAFDHITQETWEFSFNLQYNLDKNPFILSHLKKYPDENEYWTKTDIIDSLYRIETKPNKTVKDHLLMANAWFNFTRFGNSWFMLDYAYQSSFSFQETWALEYFPVTVKINRDALNTSISHYKSALQLSKNTEEKTEVIYMLAYCFYMLDDRENYKTWAKLYETLENTEFYRGENCTITPQYNSDEKLDHYFSKKRK